MSTPETGQAAERDEHGRDDYEQQQARVLMALMQGICAARYRKADNTPCPIEQGLYLGSVGAALNKEALKSLNITHILIVARSLNPSFPAEFNYKKIEGSATKQRTHTHRRGRPCLLDYIWHFSTFLVTVMIRYHPWAGTGRCLLPILLISP